jgi:twinkle protein
MTIGLIERAQQANVLRNLDLKKYLNREEMNRIIPAESLADEGRRMMLVGREREDGLTLPWRKAEGKVLIRPGKLALWVGWQHHGKSQLLKQVMAYAVCGGQKVAIASLEEEVRHIWCDMCRVAVGQKDPSTKLIDEWIAKATAHLWFYDQQGRLKADTLRAVVRYCCEELKVTQFVVDSLMMLDVGRDDYEAQSTFVAELKTLAHDTGCTIHLVAHMRKREGKGGEDSPGSAHDIAGAHDIASMADYIFNVWRDKQNKNAHGFPALLTVDKQRGQTNWLGVLGLGFHDGSRQFTEGAPTNYMNPEQAKKEYHEIANFYGGDAA